MKSSFFLILCILISIAGKSQIYVPFPDSGAVWQEVILPYPPGPMPSYMEHNHYSVSGDTLINNTSYIKLYKTQYDVNCSQFYDGPFFYGGLRNDPTERKVFFYYAEYGEEYLLYDFSLNVGDTVPNTYNNYSFPDLIVGSIDSVFVGDRFRKRFFYVEPFMEPLQVIEGIGAETGLLEPMFQFDVIHYIRCFHQFDSLYWMNTTYCLTCNLESDTCLAIYVPEHPMQADRIKVYPNPSTDRIYIDIQSDLSSFSDFYQLEIYNSLGILMKKNELSGFQYIRSIDISELQAGVYYLQIMNHQKTYVNKLLIIR